MWNVLKIYHLLTKGFTQNFKEKYHHKRKENQVSNLKNLLCQMHKFIRIIRFSEGVIRLAKIASSLKRLIWTDIFDWVWGNIFLRAFFPMSFFPRPGRKYTRKKPRRNSVNENSSKVRRNTSLKECPKFTPKLAKLSWYPILKTQS